MDTEETREIEVTTSGQCIGNGKTCCEIGRWRVIDKCFVCDACRQSDDCRLVTQYTALYHMNIPFHELRRAVRDKQVREYVGFMHSKSSSSSSKRARPCWYYRLCDLKKAFG